MEAQDEERHDGALDADDEDDGMDKTESWQAEIDGKVVRYRERAYSEMVTVPAGTFSAVVIEKVGGHLDQALLVRARSGR